jgi:hypothetical protein
MQKPVFVRKLQRVSTDSYVINVPKALIKKFGWREKQKVQITADEAKPTIQLKDWKK